MQLAARASAQTGTKPVFALRAKAKEAQHRVASHVRDGSANLVLLAPLNQRLYEGRDAAGRMQLTAHASAQTGTKPVFNLPAHAKPAQHRTSSHGRDGSATLVLLASPNQRLD